MAVSPITTGAMAMDTLPMEVFDLVRHTKAYQPHPSAAGVALVVQSSDEATSESDGAMRLSDHRRSGTWSVHFDRSCDSQVHLRVGISDEYAGIRKLNLSSNSIRSIGGHWASLHRLTSLDLSCNMLGLDPSALGNNLSELINLRSINLSENGLCHFPESILGIKTLRELRLGANKLRSIPCCIRKLTKLDVLYLGGNELESLPKAIGTLSQLRVLYLGDNRLEWLPIEIMDLHSLVTLDVHGNLLESLPREIMGMEHLQHLSVRNNPLISRFAHNVHKMVPSLLELAAASIVVSPDVKRDFTCVPDHLMGLLESARHCDNPKCKGIYFDDHSSTNVLLNDFCGRYRVPFARYVCNESCEDCSSSTVENDNAIKRVLMG